MPAGAKRTSSSPSAGRFPAMIAGARRPTSREAMEKTPITHRIIRAIGALDAAPADLDPVDEPGEPCAFAHHGGHVDPDGPTLRAHAARRESENQMPYVP